MSTRDQLLTVAAAYAAARGLSLSRVSTLACNDGKVLPSLLAGRDCTTARYDRTLSWFAAHWPAGADWPAAVSRPTVAGT